ETLGVLVGDNGDFGVMIDAVRRVDYFAVDFTGQCSLGETGPDSGGHLGDGNRRVEVLDGAVGQSNVGHGGAPKIKSADEPHFFIAPVRALQAINKSSCTFAVS